MRTKIAVGAVILAAGLASSMAQNVYSLNVVGYINVTCIGNNYTMMANQLNNGTNGLAQVLPSAPALSSVLKYNAARSDYDTAVTDGTGAWFTLGGQPSTLTVSPGEGFFFNNGDAATFTATLVGEVPQGALSVNFIANNYTLASIPTPVSLPLDVSSGFPIQPLMSYLKYNPAISDYTTYVSDGTGWFTLGGAPVTTPSPAVGEGFFINNPDTVAHAWNINFTVQ
jgi:hypothetical protein